MNITRYDPWRALEDWRQEFDRAFHPLLHREDDTSRVVGGEWAPAVDIKEEDKRYVIRADIPGVKPEDIEVTMEHGVLTIRGERKFEETEERENFKRIERSHGVFYRRFSLPDNTDADAVEATGKDGVIEVIIPKTEGKQPKRIEVTH
ncbi:MAG: Hsp20/alpha crystallin family protein [gamma proteobacterium symbiont of Ctena orbiculata]|nr:Hsp20/alpha crystallin family protein [Candidatus Thiodiazotropha sp. (ex Lucina pensylvanica)]MBT3063575.1 Hsp20/alpha crystallin family protein [Candidatus Thiodiazotropha sp. (ex Lucina pensylvanica)]MBV2093849.1 Hsp20/alpha crystallin family protein [Candidatus Thiodiazotropha sp. (ex Codakia orbicularis)]PUB73495.1 MAG: heat-shock protein Hsp20 [gamma proteobacterium symbiont of Ctena orbiculata]PUB78420.1 MAG: heat-shock protein Hsp20 [gamma proteobacterium symbiont of Ctena orbiculata